MLQYPINVYPDNVAVDKTSSSNDRDVHFTFKGDILKAYVVRFYDYKTGNVATNDTPIYDYDSTNLVFNNIGYNNGFMSASGLLTSLQTTGSYIMHMMMIEGSVSTGGLNVSRFVLRGKTTAACLSGATTIKIEDKINNIYEWDLNVTNVRSPYTVTEGAVTYDLNVMNIVINGQTIKISSYNYNTGEITLATGVSSTLAEGTSYEIYSNYLVTNQYYFNTASMPILTNLYATFDAYGIHFTGDCNDIVSCYTVTMQKKSSSGVYYNIAKTGKIYSQLIKYDFCDDYDYIGIGGNDTTKTYRFIVNAVTQNGFNIMGASDDIVAPSRENTEVVVSTSVSVLRYDNSVSVHIEKNSETTGAWGYRIYRIDTKENYGSFPYKQLVCDSSGSYGGFYDFTASTHGSYKYMIVPYYYSDLDSTRIANAVLTDEITTEEYGYTITAITDTDKNADGKPFYLIGDTYKFMVDIDGTTVTQNLDNVLHVGYGKYSSKTSTNVNYASGTVSAYLGQVYCNGSQVKYEDTIKIVRKWREFISQDCQFILRSQKGDVWLVNIIENPTTEYEEDVAVLPTKFTFSWAECGSIDDILIGKELPPRYEERE